MIYFFSDNHYGADPGRHQFECLPEDLRKKTVFTLDDWSVLESGTWEKDCDLLILNMIGETCDQPHPGAGAEEAVKRYYQRGGNILLLHGSSAAFWKWDWWREIVGLRWTRGNDPDGQAVSTHPIAPCTIKVAKSRHPLVRQLREITLPEDEIYTALEETCPIMTLMSTVVNGETWPQCCEVITPCNGKIVSLIPGHKPECTRNPDLIYNLEVLIRYLLNK
ncbi:MAG: ThuA domain-containing protein [Lentisphaeria bacterium]|nr:ThuA domain-containing protein [Lentisphaeria bacterium]